ncbi:MAG TPA: hypothetical protein VGR62_08035 [Candidatus Binatia bacterium]|jgi:outer membrane protein assembly factor BamB|nr:hypothetical protein [Candidatus Binatia bacterium]
MLRTSLALWSVVFATMGAVGPCLAQPYGPIAVIGPGLRFGSAIASTRHRVAIGAPGDDSTGAVVLYDARTLAWVTSLEAPGAHQYDFFGKSIAAVNGEFAIGAPGMAQIHLMTPDGRIRRTISAPGDVVGANRSELEFGRVIAASHGLVVTTVQSAYRPDETLTRSMLYAFAADTGELRWAREISVRYPGIVASGGWVAVGAPCRGCATRERRVYVFDVDTGRPVSQIAPPPGVDDELFGFSLTFARRHLLVGAPSGFGGGAYEYDVPSGRLLQTYRDAEETGPWPQYLGMTVTYDGRFVLVGAPSFVAPRPGAVYVFERSSGRIVQRLQGRFDDGHFGSVLGRAGRLLLVGSGWPSHGYVEAFARTW